MKKLILIAGLTTLTALSGCSKDMGNRDIYQESGNTINVNNKRADLYHEGASRNVRDMSTDYGFVRHQKSPILNDRSAPDYTTALNREQIANIISKLSTNLPDVNDAATLVTDQEVLIVYNTNSQDRNATADQVKRTAMAVVPRYFHVFVSDNARLMREVQALAHLESTNKHARSQVIGLINQMKKSPQGDRMSTVEDENGMTSNDHNRGSGMNK